MDEKSIFKYLKTEDIKQSQSGRMFDNYNPAEKFLHDSIPAVKTFTETPLPFKSALPFTTEKIASVIQILHQIASPLQQSPDFKKMVEIYKARFPDRKDIEKQVIQSYLFKALSLHPQLKVKQNDSNASELAYLFREVINKAFAGNTVNDPKKITNDVCNKILDDLKTKLIQNFFSILTPESSDLLNAITAATGSDKTGQSATSFQRLGNGLGINMLLDHLSSLPKKNQLVYLKACKNLPYDSLSEEAQTVLGALQTHLETLNPPSLFEKAKNFLSGSPKEAKEKHHKKADAKTPMKDFDETFTRLSLQWERLKNIDTTLPPNVDKLTKFSHALNDLLDDKAAPKSISFEAEKLLQALVNKLQSRSSNQQSENTTSPRTVTSSSSPRIDVTASQSELALEGSGAESSDDSADLRVKHSH